MFQTKYKEIPMSKYKIVQTGPKIAFGGLKLGFFNLLYHLSMAFIVKTEPIIPANSHRSIETISLNQSIMIF